MKGDIVVVEEYHREAAQQLAPALLRAAKDADKPIAITVAGESGSGKSELAQAIADEFAKADLRLVILGQDDYFRLPPQSNDRKRREDPDWLGPHVEVNLPLMDQHLRAIKAGASQLEKPLINYDEDQVESEVIEITNVDGGIAEGTYTSLLKEADLRIFIQRNRLDTLEHRQKRNRGNEVGDPFIENVLKIEHKIIAGHANLADFLISKEFKWVEHD